MGESKHGVIDVLHIGATSAAARSVRNLAYLHDSHDQTDLGNIIVKLRRYRISPDETTL